MGSICANVQYTTSRSRFVKPCVEAPRQVIGFDLSPNSDGYNVVKGDPIAELHSNCTNSCPISSKTANTTTATSPRSALQQLLLPLLPQSEPASAFSTIGPTHGPLVAPTCKSQAATTCSRGGLPTFTREQCTAVVKLNPVQAAPSNWPICKGIAELVTPLQHANDGKNGSSSGGVVNAIKCVAGDGKKSHHARETSIYELPRRSERNCQQGTWNFKDQLQAELPSARDKREKSSWMKEVTIGIEKPESNSVDISWKQANMNIPEKSTKKSSLFMLAASSPTAELYSKHHHLHGIDQYSSHNNIDMDFLNSCFLCKRLLGQGHDVFMYSGDKAFCSMECRYQQIVIDERMKRRAPPVIRSGASPVYQGYMASARPAVVTAAATATTHHPIKVNRPNFMNPAAAA